jgi:hypothetical protein
MDGTVPWCSLPVSGNGTVPPSFGGRDGTENAVPSAALLPGDLRLVPEWFALEES